MNVTTYDFRTRSAAEDNTPQEEAFNELLVADYLVFLFAFDTYVRWLKEADVAPPDPVFSKGLSLLRRMDQDRGSEVIATLEAGIKSPGSLTQLASAMKVGISGGRSACLRSLRLRSILLRGGVATAKHIFGTSIKARKEVLEALGAAMSDSAVSALAQFGTITLKNKRLENWISSAAARTGQPFLVSPVLAAANQVGEASDELVDQKIVHEAALPTSEAHAESRREQGAILATVQGNAQEAAAKALSAAGMPDEPLKKSEVIGIATAVATAVSNDPADMKNVPPAFVNKGRPLDPEQMDAARTNGKVLVAAGAGAGKSTTLVSRVAYLIDNLKTNPARIMAVTFSRKAADELQEKISKKVGDARGKAVFCDTMHTLFKKFIVGDERAGVPQLGTPEQKRMMERDLIATPQKGKPPPRVKPGDLSRAIQNIWGKCKPEQLAQAAGRPNAKESFADPPKAKKAGLFINKWSGNDVSYQQALANAKSDGELKAALYYQMYLGLKGDIPGWKPLCGTEDQAKFMNKFRPGGERLGDMDDMLKIFRDILRDNPKAKETIQGMFDHILIDEAQDSNLVQHQIFDLLSEKIECDDKKKSIWLVGDDRQCVSVDTPISVPGGVKQAVDLVPGDSVLAFRNGENVEQTVRHVVPSSWTWGYRITTESGKSLLMSPNHKLWATSPVLEEGSMIVYLMYRKDMGFRVGITNHCEDESAPFGRRTLSERAERLWILDLVSSREEALYREESYSLKYGIPTAVFEGTNRGLNQERIDKVFQAFGMNGAKLLEERHLSFDLPNWMAYSNSKGKADRRTLQFIMHAPKGSQVSLEWSGDEFDAVLSDVRHEHLESGRHRLRRFFTNYREALTFAEDLKIKMKVNLRKRLSTPEGPMSMLTASALVPSMSVPVRSGDTVVHEQIVSIEKVGGTFVDLDVDDASNFFGGDILSSNSIYQFRGAKPELFQKHWDDGCWKPKKIRTNYRCPPEVVEMANRLVAHNPDRLPVDAVPNPAFERGKSSIFGRTMGDNTEAAVYTMDSIRKDMETDPKNRPEDYAILARTNNELNNFETACIINEIPYTRRGGHGFLDAPESKCVLGYLDLASGTSNEKKVESLAAALNKPDRGLFNGGRLEPIVKAINDTIDDLARAQRKDKKDIDPGTLITDRFSAQKFAENLKMPYKNQLTAKGTWLWDKVTRGLQSQLLDMGRDVEDIRTMITKEDTPTVGLLEHILDNVKATVTMWNPTLRREVTQTMSLREDLSHSMKLYGGSDDEDEEETDDDENKPVLDENGNVVKEEAQPNLAKGLGAVQFLYSLAEPNKNDHDQGILPNTAAGFVKKIERFTKLADTLRIDNRKWEDAQKKITDPALRQEKPPAVTLTTVHSVKGLEWPHCTVLVPGGLFPIELKAKPDEPPPTEEEQKEHDVSELNLAYVALTRAAKTLDVISIPKVVRDKKTGRVVAVVPSKFIDMMGLKEGQNVPKPEAEFPLPPPAVPAVVTANEEALFEISQWPDIANPSYDRRPS